jgi:hypothetical protein
MDAKNLHFGPFRPIVPNSTISFRAIFLPRSHSGSVSAWYLRVSSVFQHAPGVVFTVPALDVTFDLLNPILHPTAHFVNSLCVG